MELTTDQKGAIAESAIVHAAIKLGIDVYRPVSEGGRYDMLLDLRPRLVRLQCKWASFHNDVLVIRAYSCRRSRDGLLKRAYSPEEIDAIGAYCLALDRCFYFPIEWLGDRTTIQLRVGPSRNNQRARINWADDYAFERLTFGLDGAIAQLGERLRGTQEVGGSSPPGSTHPGGLPLDGMAFEHRRNSVDH